MHCYSLYRASAQQVLAGIGNPKNWSHDPLKPTRKRPFVHRIEWDGYGWVGPELHRRLHDEARQRREVPEWAGLPR